ncbi:MAG: SRPBCC family protein [Actinobacteria bacterium]|nr:SRPBCC family protein [Actinomycetota bacterium]
MNDPADAGAGDDVSLTINAGPERLYELVSDITKMGRLSPECTGGRWLGSAKGPQVGARFIGTNKRGFVRWFTFNKVVVAEPGREFAFETRDTRIRWSYRFAGNGPTKVTESRVAVGKRPAPARVFTRLLLGGGASHEQELRDGMRATLDRLKALAETPV